MNLRRDVMFFEDKITLNLEPRPLLMPGCEPNLPLFRLIGSLSTTELWEIVRISLLDSGRQVFESKVDGIKDLVKSIVNNHYL